MEEDTKKLVYGIKAVAALMDESLGVTGLYRDGDIVDWRSLREGGRFEGWLYDFDKALEVVDRFDREQEKVLEKEKILDRILLIILLCLIFIPMMFLMGCVIYSAWKWISFAALLYNRGFIL